MEINLNDYRLKKSNSIDITLGDAVGTAIDFIGKPMNLWDMSKRLADLGVINQLDKMALALYCDNYAVWVEAGMQLAKEGQSIILTGKRNGGAYRNLWFDVRRQAEARIFQYMALFGLSPADRSKLKISTPEDDLEDNPFAHI